MKRGYGVGDRFSQDPIGSDAPRGKDTSRRKHRNDPGWTPTELHQRNEMMRQFMRNPEGEPNGSAYKNSPVWCPCGRRMKLDGADKCESCLSSEYFASTSEPTHNGWLKFVSKRMGLGPQVRPTPPDRPSRLLGPDATTPHPDRDGP